MLAFIQKVEDQKAVPQPLLENIKEHVKRSKNLLCLNSNGSSLLHALCVNKEVDLDLITETLNFGLDSSKANNFSYTPLMLAIINGRKDIYDLLKKKVVHDYNARNINNENLVHMALQGANPEILRDVLKNVLDYNHPDKLGRTPLHYAAIAGPTLFNILIQDGRMNLEAMKQDIFGDTPLDLAARYNHQEVFDVLSQGKAQLSAHPKYNQPLLNISQNNLNTKLLKYLAYNDRDLSLIDLNKGACNGWAFVCQTYLPDREKEYNAITDLVASWDGKKESLKTLALPNILKNEYSNAEDVFEQLTNDLVWFFHSVTITSAMQLRTNQYSRLEQFEMATSVDRVLQPIFDIGGIKNRNQMIEDFEYLRTFPETTVDISVPGHAISLFITKEGTFKLFESNLSERTRTFDSAEEVVDIIINNTLIKSKGQNSHAIDYQAYKISKQNIQLAIPRLPSNFDFTHGPNNNTELHYAVLDDDEQKIKKILAKKPELLLKNNQMNENPLILALQNNRVGCFKAMLDASELENNHLEIILDSLCYLTSSREKQKFVTMVVDCMTSISAAMLEKILLNPILPINLKFIIVKSASTYVDKIVDLNLKDENSFSPPIMVTISENHKPFFDLLLSKNTSFLNANFDKSESVYTKCLDNADPYFITQILNNMGDNLDKLDPLGNNLLHWAIIKGKPEVVKACLQQGAKIDIKNQAGKDASELIKEFSNKEIAALIHQRSEPSPHRQSLTFSTERVKPFLAENPKTIAQETTESHASRATPKLKE